MAKRKKKAKGVQRSTRKTKDGKNFAVNIYIHGTLLDRLDKDANAQRRTRKSQLELVLCEAYGVDPQKLDEQLTKQVGA